MVVILNKYHASKNTVNNFISGFLKPTIYNINMNAQDLFEVIDTLFNDFRNNHTEWKEKGTKAAAGRARKAIGELKKKVTDYRKASVAETR